MPSPYWCPHQVLKSTNICAQPCTLVQKSKLQFMHSYLIPILKGIYSLERVLRQLGYFFRITQSYPTGPKLNKYSTYKTYLHLLKRLPQQRTNWTIQLKGSSNSIQVVSSELLLTAWKHKHYHLEELCYISFGITYKSTVKYEIQQSQINQNFGTVFLQRSTLPFRGGLAWTSR